MSRTVLVTGATGFVGGHLARRLQRRGDRVRVFVRPGTKAEALRKEQFEMALGELTDAQAVDRAIAGCDIVFHVAAQFRVEGVPEAEFFAVNRDGTRNIFEAARKHGARRVVHTSTVGVHGAITHPPTGEDAPLAPIDHYQRSKLEGEQLAHAYFRDGQPGSVVRPTGIYGPGDTRFLKLYRAIARQRFVMIGPGTIFYHPTYIDDLIDGYELAATHPSALGQAYIFAGPEYVTLSEYVNRIARALDVPTPHWRVPMAPVLGAAIACAAVSKILHVEPILYPRRLEFFRHHRAFDISKARRDLGYQPRIGLDEGIQRTIAWYRQEKLLA